MFLNSLNKTKIFLIYPPFNFSRINKFKHFIPIYPPLGLAYIASVLEKAGYEVKIIDAKVEFLSINKILNRIKEFNPQLIGISSSTPDFCMSRSLANQIKSIGDYTILIGGPHVSALPEETMNERCFDYGILGEGEHTILQLVNALSQDNIEEILNITGIVFRNGSKVIRTPPRDYIEDLDTVPFPARHLLVDVRKYSYSWYKRLPTATLITTRGCPYQCIFCDRAVFGNRLRMRSINNILDEIELLVRKYRIRGIDIVDDLFTVTPQRVMEFCSRLIERRLKVAWSCLSRVDHVNLETLKAMKRAGCWQIIYGVESANQNVLNSSKKNISLQDIEKAIFYTRKADVEVAIFFMLGLPGDTEEGLKETLKFSKKIPLNKMAMRITQPFPGSELYKTAFAKGEITKDVEYRYYHSICLPKKFSYVTSGLSTKILKRYWHKFYRNFYIRPLYVIKRVIEFHEFKKFLNKAVALLRAIF